VAEADKAQDRASAAAARLREAISDTFSVEQAEWVGNCSQCLVAQAMNGETTCERCAL